MKIITGPVWTNHKTHGEAETTANGNGVEPLVRKFQYIVDAKARNSYQIKGQEEDKNSIIVVLLYVGDEPHVCSCGTCH